MIILGVKLSRWHFKAIKAFGAFVALGLILAVVYAQHQSYKYIVSNKALKKAYLQEDVAKMVTNAEGVWEWFGAVVDRANVRELQSVVANCAYELPLGTDVTIENTTYSLYDPTLQDHSCLNPQYPLSENTEKSVFLSGNHEVLTFGLFQSRSVKKLSKDKSQGANLPGRSILTPELVSLDPMMDERIIEVCQVLTPTNSTDTPSLCVLRDGYAGTLGTTFGWAGKYMQEISRPAYEHSFEDRHMKVPQQPFRSMSPCYSYNATTDELINNPAPANLSECEYFWTTSGASMRSDCILDMDSQPSPMFAFIASVIGAPTVFQTLNLFMGCDTLVDISSQYLHQYFVSTPLAIQNHLEREDMYGTFFLTETNLKWMTFANFYAKELNMHRFIDNNTRKLSVLTVLRNLGDENLFYALVNVTFTIAVSGEFQHYFDVQYVPIIQYYYGLDNYEYVHNEVVLSETLFLIPLTLLVLSVISYKTYVYVYPLLASEPPTCNGSDKGQHDRGNNAAGGFTTPLDPLGLPPPPPPRQNLNIVSFQVDEESFSLGEVDSIDSESDYDNIHIRKSSQQRKNRNSSTQIENTNIAEISLRDCSSVLLPNEEEADNMSSASEEESEEEDNDEQSGSAINSAADIPGKSLAVLKKQVSFVTKTSTKSMKSVTKIIKKNKTNKYKKYFSFCVIVIFITTFTLRVLYIMEARDLHIFLTSQEVMEPTGSIFSGYDTHFEDIIEKFEKVQRLEVLGRSLAVVCVFVALTQFFSYLTFDKRFGLVTATLIKAVRDIVPMLIILLSVLFTYSVLGSVIYGQSIEDFSDVGSSLSALLIIMLGEVQVYEEMKVKNKILTMMYFWSFVILVVFIIFNMVLALIFTLYDEEYRDLKASNARQREEAEKKRKERIAAIKRKKFLRRTSLRTKMGEQ